MGPLNTATWTGECCKLPQWCLGQTIWCILESKSAALVAAVFFDIPQNICNFLHKIKLDIVRQVQFLIGQRPMRSFSPGATIALWLSVSTRVSGTRKVKPIWILLKQETMSGSGISWAIRNYAPCSRQITTPAPRHSVFYRPMPFLPPNQQHQSTEGMCNICFILHTTCAI